MVLVARRNLPVQFIVLTLIVLQSLGPCDLQSPFVGIVSVGCFVDESLVGGNPGSSSRTGVIIEDLKTEKVVRLEGQAVDLLGSVLEDDMIHSPRPVL